jgi:hypothetical protein
LSSKSRTANEIGGMRIGINHKEKSVAAIHRYAWMLHQGSSRLLTDKSIPVGKIVIQCVMLLTQIELNTSCDFVCTFKIKMH